MNHKRVIHIIENLKEHNIKLYTYIYLYTHSPQILLPDIGNTMLSMYLPDNYEFRQLVVRLSRKMYIEAELHPEEGDFSTRVDFSSRMWILRQITIGDTEGVSRHTTILSLLHHLIRSCISGNLLFMQD